MVANRSLNQFPKIQVKPPMIDLHCHLLDETACGPKTFQESLEMCRLAVADGIHTIVATPLWEAGASEPPLSLLACASKIECLSNEMEGALRLELGFMMKFRLDLPLLLDKFGTTLTLGQGRYVLVSLPLVYVPNASGAVWRDIASRGFSVLLSRPECNPSLRRRPEILDEWVRSGVNVQLDAASILGTHGREVQRFAVQSIGKYKNSVVIGSNAPHSHLNQISLKQARAKLAKVIGKTTARAVFSVTPARILGRSEQETQKGNSLAYSSNSFRQLFSSGKRLFGVS
jgi:protein-tyrosine phosphatase